MKIPVFATEAKLNGWFSILRYDVVKNTYIELRSEFYPSLEVAKERAKELNKDVDPIELYK